MSGVSNTDLVGNRINQAPCLFAAGRVLDFLAKKCIITLPTKKGKKMTKYTHPNGDTIETDGQKFTVTRSGVEQNTDLSHWNKNAEGHIDGDIRAGYYAGFKKEVSDV